MWRDILIIAAFAIATLNYFGIGPARILSYTRVARAEIAKRRPYQRIFLFCAIGISGLCVRVFILIFERKDPLEYFLFGIVLLYMFWDTTLHDVWKLSDRKERILDGVRRFGMLPLFITCIVLFDMPLWQKIVYPISGFCIGLGTSKLSHYIDRKRKERHSSKGIN